MTFTLVVLYLQKQEDTKRKKDFFYESFNISLHPPPLFRLPLDRHRCSEL